MKLTIFSVLSTLSINLFTKLKGKPIGVDEFGNKYFESKPRGYSKRPRRWVIYKNDIEASNVPPLWHGWLHHQTNELPEVNEGFKKKWQKDHIANQTGTDNAYLPDGHPLKKGKRAKATGDFEAWNPSA